MVFHLFKNLFKSPHDVLVEEVKSKPNKIYDRLKALYDELEASTYKYVELKDNIKFYKGTSYSFSSTIFYISVNTKLGWRNFKFEKDNNVSSSPTEPSFTLEMYDENDEVLFSIFTYISEYSNYVSVEPLLGEHLTAREVDLAIYELEQICKGYKSIKERKLTTHQKEVNKLKNGVYRWK